MQPPVILLKPGKEQSLRRFHPWVFSGAVNKTRGSLIEGDLVEVRDARDNFLAYGHFQVGSIAVRVITFRNEEVNEEFWYQKILSAWNLRQAIGLAGSERTNAFRLVNGEGDGMPGLIVDIYGTTAVVQFHTVAMFRLRDTLVRVLLEVMGSELTDVYDKSGGTLPFKSDVTSSDGYIYGRGSNAPVIENGLKFHVDYEKGQKTGFFVDQRENRAMVEKFCKGRAVLNMFCYTGGFSFYAMRGGAKLVHSVDSSERAIELTNANVELNFPADNRHQSFAADAFKYLEGAKGKYDLIILDPPAFAKHLNVVNNALQGYKRLNSKAIEQISPGGIIFTFSCSQVVSREAFRTMIFSAAARANRAVRVISQMAQPPDHPASIYHPEGEYLKGLVLHVE